MITVFGNVIIVELTDSKEVELMVHTERGVRIFRLTQDKIVKVTEEGEVVICE